MDKLGFGIVGCGRIAERHLQAIQEEDRARLVAVCDILPQRAKAKGEKYKVPSYGSMAEMLAAQPGIDIVSILTPSGDHADSAVAAVEAGKHVVVEKPMALTLEDAERMILTANAHGRRLFCRQTKPLQPSGG